MDESKRKKPQSETRERRAEVLTYLEENGPYSIPVNELSEKWKCSKLTIYKDRDFWIKKIDITKIDDVGKRLIYTIRQNIQLAEQLRKRGSDKDRLKAIDVGNKSAELVTRLMEQYGFKEKIAEKTEHLVKHNKLILEIIDARSEDESEPSDEGNEKK